MLVEYDVLARDHQDAMVSFVTLISFCQWQQVLLIYFIVTGKGGGKAKWHYNNLLLLGAGFEIY